MIGARFRVVRGGDATVLRPIVGAIDEGLFAGGDPSGSIQLGNLSPDAAALMPEGAEIRIYVLAGAAGDQIVIGAEQWATAIPFPDAAAKARALELLAEAPPALEDRLAALRREVEDLTLSTPPAGALYGPMARQQLELAWLAIRLAAGTVELNDPPATAGKPPG